MSSWVLDNKSQKCLLDKLNNFIVSACEQFPFYQEWLKGSKRSLTQLDQYLDFPFLDKAEQPVWDLASQALANPSAAYFETSGTSGKPFPILPDFSNERMQEFSRFIHEWLSLDSMRVSRAIIALPFEINPIGLKYYFALSKLGIMSIPTGVRTHLCSPKKLVDIMQRLKPELLIARPMEALRYARIMYSENSIQKIILTGEVVSFSKFKRLKLSYPNADIYSVYGLTEVDSAGMSTCINHEYHIPSGSSMFIELLADDWKTPIRENGQIGHIVLTNLNLNKMPLIRYKTGDMGVLKTQCSIGCSLKTPIITVMGRSTDRIITDNAVIFPIQIENSLLENPAIFPEIQMYQNKRTDDLFIFCESLENLSQIELSKLGTNLEKKLMSELSLKKVSVRCLSSGQLINPNGIAKTKACVLGSLDESVLNAMPSPPAVNYLCSEEV
jgi:phenylacetate-CoA ligase